MMTQPLIESYTFGRMVVGGKEYGRDLIITPNHVVSPWWREEGHKVTLKDLEEVINLDVECIVIGTGYSGLVEVSEDVIRYCRERGVRIYIADTRKASEIYNELVRRGAKVIGAFHLTC